MADGDVEFLDFLYLELVLYLGLLHQLLIPKHNNLLILELLDRDGKF